MSLVSFDIECSSMGYSARKLLHGMGSSLTVLPSQGQGGMESSRSMFGRIGGSALASCSLLFDDVAWMNNRKMWSWRWHELVNDIRLPRKDFEFWFNLQFLFVVRTTVLQQFVGTRNHVHNPHHRACDFHKGSICPARFHCVDCGAAYCIHCFIDTHFSRTAHRFYDWRDLPCTIKTWRTAVAWHDSLQTQLQHNEREHSRCFNALMNEFTQVSAEHRDSRQKQQQTVDMMLRAQFDLIQEQHKRQKLEQSVNKLEQVLQFTKDMLERAEQQVQQTTVKLFSKDDSNNLPFVPVIEIKWEWLNDANVFVPYSHDIQQCLRGVATKSNQRLIFTIGQQEYTIYPHLQLQRNNTTHHQRPIRRSEYTVLYVNPDYRPPPTRVLLPKQEMSCLPMLELALKDSDPTYAFVRESFQGNEDAAHPFDATYELCHIFKVDEPRVRTRFEAHSAWMPEKTPVTWLFHGTAYNNWTTVVREGLDVRVSNPGLLGQAIYLTDSLAYIHHGNYKHTSAPDENGDTVYTVLLVATWLGHIQEYKVPDKTLRRPPLIHDNVRANSTSLVADSPIAARVHAVYDNAQTYPAFVVQYRNKKPTSSKSTHTTTAPVQIAGKGPVAANAKARVVNAPVILGPRGPAGYSGPIGPTGPI